MCCVVFGSRKAISSPCLACFGIHWNKLARLLVYWMVCLDECEREAREGIVQLLSRFYLSPNISPRRFRFLATSRPNVDTEWVFHSEIEGMALVKLK